MSKFNCSKNETNYFIVRKDLKTGDYIKLEGAFKYWGKALERYNHYINSPNYESWLKETPDASPVMIIEAKLSFQVIKSGDYVQNKKDFMKKLNRYLKRNGVTGAPLYVNGEEWYIDFNENTNRVYAGPKVDGKVVNKQEHNYDEYGGWPMCDILDDFYIRIDK